MTGVQTCALPISIDKSLETETLKFTSDLDEFLSKSDFISLHCPSTKETKEIINKENLNKMKKSAFLINTSRGTLVNEEDLKEALNNNVIAGAALDVVYVDPMKRENPLLKAKNCIITPHIAWGSEESMNRLVSITVENIKNFLDGNITNQVN